MAESAPAIATAVSERTGGNPSDGEKFHPCHQFLTLIYTALSTRSRVARVRSEVFDIKKL